MDEPTAPTHRWPVALLLAVLGFAGLDHALWTSDAALRFLDRYTPLGPTDSLMTVKARLAPAAGDAPLILLMGSSQVREGLDCEVFEARVPRSQCRNLASIGGTLLDILFLQARIAPRAQPRTMVLGLFPWMFNQPPKTFYTDAGTVACLTEGGAWRAMSLTEDRAVAYGLLASLSETLRNRRAIPPILDVAFDDPVAALRLELPPPDQRLGSPLGARLFRPEAELDQRIANGPYENPPPTFARAHEEALDRVITHERALGGRVVVVDFPTRPGYEKVLSAPVRARYTRFLERLRARTDINFVGAEDLPALSTADFNDFTHLSAVGRARVSSRVAEILAGLL